MPHRSSSAQVRRYMKQTLDIQVAPEVLAFFPSGSTVHAARGPLLRSGASSAARSTPRGMEPSSMPKATSSWT